MGELYRLDFPSGKSYIGVTTQTALKRLTKHRYTAKASTKGVLYRAWRKYGEPVMTVLAIVEDRDLATAEIRAVLAFGTAYPGGYNVSPGGSVISADTARRLSEAQKGRVFTDEHRAKLAAAKRGTSRGRQIRVKMSAAQQRRRAMEGCIPQRWRYPGVSA